MAARPAWVKALWATPERRLLLSLGLLAVAAWILISAFWDRDAFFQHRQSAVAFVAAPLIVLMFGVQAVEAIGDLLRKGNTPIPVFHRIGWRLDARRGLAFLGLYLVVMLALLVAMMD
jgi:hypothetical protein